MRGACLAFVAGAWWLQQQASLLSSAEAVAVGVAALVVGACARGACAVGACAVGACAVGACAAGACGSAPLPDARRDGQTVDRHPAADGAAGSHPRVVDEGDVGAPAGRPNHARSEGAVSEVARGPVGAATRVRDRAAVLVAVRACVRKRVRLRLRVGAALPVAAAFVVGFAWADWRADRRLAESLPHALENKDVVVVGTVAVLPSSDALGTRFEFDVDSVVSRDERGRVLTVPRHLALGWYRPRGGTARAGAAATDVPDLRPGQRWRLTVRLKRPHGAANPSGFDYEYWLLEEGLRATGYVRPGADPANAGAGDVDGTAAEPDEPGDRAAAEPATSTRKLAEFVWSPGHVVERARALLRDRILAALGDRGPVATQAPYAGVIVALVVGDQRAIAQSDWTVFNRTGIGHLVSISGLHVSMLAALGSWLTFAAWRRRPAWCARLAAHRAAAVSGTAVALAYCLLAGFGVPAQRTLYMIGIVAFALWTDRLVTITRVLSIALAAIVAIDPWAVTGSGFWLSFGAVAAIFYVTSGRLVLDRSHRPWSARAWHALGTAARVQWAVTLALTPLTLLFFYQVSVIGPVANALAIPLVSFVVTPMSLAGAVVPGAPGSWLLHGAHGLVALLAAWLQWLSAAPVAVWAGAAPGAAAFVAAMVGVAWWLAPRGIVGRWTGGLWLVPLFVAVPDRTAIGTVRFTALDIGQGTSVLIETAATNVLYDTGPVYSPDNDAGNRIIVPYLRSRGIGRLDAMIVSHNDNDHSGGALSVLQSIDVDEVRSSLAFATPIVRAARYHVRCRPGQSWTADGVSFELIGPSPDVYLARDGTASTKAIAKPNARSCVLRVEAAGHAMLLTADIEKPQEAALVERAPGRLGADAMLVPHHGSRTSSSDAFLDAVRPRIAIVQAGYLNRFGHPRPDVLARYAARSIEVLRNDSDGAITVTLEPAGVHVARYRESHLRYWYGR